MIDACGGSREGERGPKTWPIPFFFRVREGAIEKLKDVPPTIRSAPPAADSFLSSLGTAEKRENYPSILVCLLKGR